MENPLPQDVKQWAMACHLSSLAWIVLPIPYIKLLAPILIWLAQRDRHPFIDSHGKESVNFQISMAIYWTAAALVGGVWFFLTTAGAVSGVIPNPDEVFVLVWFFQLMVTFFLLPLLITLLESVLAIFAAIKASDGQFYRYPFTIRFVK